MTKKNETLKLDLDSFIAVSEGIVDNDQVCQEVLENHKKLFEKLKENYSTEIAMEVDNIVSYVELAVREAVYKAAFQSGMRFILNAITGGEVIEL